MSSKGRHTAASCAPALASPCQPAHSHPLAQTCGRWAARATLHQHLLTVSQPLTADVWALGCILHELCTLRPTFLSSRERTEEDIKQRVRVRMAAHFSRGNSLPRLLAAHGAGHFKQRGGRFYVVAHFRAGHRAQAVVSANARSGKSWPHPQCQLSMLAPTDVAAPNADMQVLRGSYEPIHTRYSLDLRKLVDVMLQRDPAKASAGFFLH